ncbi:hypothetical protein [Haloechinothrix halophila]|uniref:hypothetical protein n=1 Tax=Haloechinothrix halophila TaxID=1069073 RepID=UPI0003F5F67E|nr:hypothetical protein [Haloechinothrix halophila]
MIRHKWVPRGTNTRTCEICGMAVERKPDRRFAWTLRDGKAVLIDGEHVSAGQSPTLKALPGCGSDQKPAPQHIPSPRYGVFLRRRAEKTVQRMTPAGRITDDASWAAVFPSEHWAQRRAEEFQQQLDAQHPGIEVWTAPL